MASILVGPADGRHTTRISLVVHLNGRLVKLVCSPDGRPQISVDHGRLEEPTSIRRFKAGLRNDVFNLPKSLLKVDEEANFDDLNQGEGEEPGCLNEQTAPLVHAPHTL